MEKIGFKSADINCREASLSTDSRNLAFERFRLLEEAVRGGFIA